MASPVPPFGLSRIGQIAIVVRDIRRSVAFYRDVLGMRLLFEAPQGLAFFDCGGIRVMLSLPEGSEPEPATTASVIYYSVDNIEEAAQTLTARGVAFERDPHLIAKLPHADLWMAFFRDPDRHLLALMSEVTPAGRSLPMR